MSRFKKPEKLKNVGNLTLIVASAVLFMVVVIIIAIFTAPGDTTESQIKEAVSSSIGGRTDFKIKSIVMQDGGWYLVEIESTSSDDSGNSAYAVLKKENRQLKAVLGPGTTFTAAALVAVGAPDSIVRYLTGQGERQVIWAGFDEFAREHSEAWRTGSVNMIEKYSQGRGINLKKVAVVNGSIVRYVENARSENASEHLELKFTINDEPSIFTINILASAKDTTGTLTNETGEVLEQAIYSVN